MTDETVDPMAGLELTVEQAAQLTVEHGGTEQRIRQLAKDGKIPFKQDKPRAAIRIVHHDLDMVRKALTEMVKRGPGAVKASADILQRIEALEAAVFTAATSPVLGAVAVGQHMHTPPTAGPAKAAEPAPADPAPAKVPDDDALPF